MKRMFVLFVLMSICTFGQETNTIVTDSSSGKPMLVGYVTRDAFKDTSFSWFDSEYNDYKPDVATTRLFMDKVKDFFSDNSYGDMVQ